VGVKGYKTITAKYCLVPIDFADTAICYDTGDLP